ncbi:MAG TPA: hypothetical protein VLK27_00130 [Chthoniobacterales bacterium]|nr:hypothetical protein [Chthoniobacterales bacterium]
MRKIKPYESGSSLVVVILIMATLAVIVGITLDYSTNVNRLVQRTTTLQTAVAAADATIEQLFTNWRAICRASPSTALASNAFSGIPLPTNAQLNLPGSSNFAKAGTNADTSDEYFPDYTVSNIKVVAVDGTLQSLGGSTIAPPPAAGMLPSPAPTPPLPPTTSAAFNYVASADVTLPTVRGNVVAKVHRVFSKTQLSPWNFAIFYVDPLEIHPGAAMTVTGWVNTNSSLYTGHKNLTFADKVTYASDWFASTSANPMTGFMPGDQQHASSDPLNGTPTYVSNLPPARDVALQPFGMDSTAIFSTSDSNPNNDSYRELVEPPVATSTDPFAGQRFWDQAGIIIKIQDNPNSNANGFDGVKGHDLVNLYIVSNQQTGATQTLTSGSLYTMFTAAGAITTNQTIQDNREGAQIRLTTLDISKLVTTVSSGNPNYTSSFGTPIVYIYDASATSSARRAIRIKGGSKIPTSGLTITSNNPIYIQGDYNTGGSPPSDSTSQNDPTKPQVSGYTRAPCSVIGDAINLLSNNWNDANSTSDTSARLATNTTFNTAILSGIIPTAAPGGDGSYSGGAENFPRFLEDWGHNSAIVTYYGSMVELYKSQQSTGEWGSSNVYVPPIRHWYFDQNFRTKPPPGSLMVYSYTKGQWAMQ